MCAIITFVIRWRLLVWDVVFVSLFFSRFDDQSQELEAVRSELRKMGTGTARSNRD